MADYTEYLLQSDRDISDFKNKIGSKYLPLQAKVDSYIQTLPGNGSWICFWQDVPVKNIPYIVGMICIYIQEKWSPYDIIEFNSTATMLRRKFSEPNRKKILTYAEYRTKIQNNDGCSRK